MVRLADSVYVIIAVHVCQVSIPKNLPALQWVIVMIMVQTGVTYWKNKSSKGVNVYCNAQDGNSELLEVDPYKEG